MLHLNLQGNSVSSLLTFSVYVRQQLSEGPPDPPSMADIGRHHLQEVLSVLLPQDGHSVQDQLHLFQLMGSCNPQ